MPQFIYTAMDGNGKEQKGKIEAASEDAASSALKAKGLFPTSLKPAVAAVKKGLPPAPARRRGAA